LLCAVTSTFAQKADTVKTVTKFIPTGVRAGIDIVSIARTQYGDSFEGFEANIDTDIYRYYPTIEFGNSARNYLAESGSTYNNDGTFWRAGVDVNFMKKDPDKNMFFLGARFGQARYSEKATLITIDPMWGSFENSYVNNNLNANWLELTTGLRVKVWKFFWMGYTARFKFGLNVNNDLELLTTDVPGYGSTDKETAWGFSYYLMVRLPVRKQK
jgi:Domain of unknown function (DUF6048)